MEPLWIWQQADWPHFRWRDSEILPRLRQVQRRLGILIVNRPYFPRHLKSLKLRSIRRCYEQAATLHRRIQ
ncbi:DUF4172 domain-containing protein, partial [Aeromonas hydrophila]